MFRRSPQSLLPPSPSLSDGVPPQLRRWWSGYPRLALKETGAFLLPRLLPLLPKDRLLVVGAENDVLASALAARSRSRTPPTTVHHHRSAVCVTPAAVPANVVHATEAALPFRDRQFTVVVAGHQIHSWDDAALLQFLEEAWRVLTHNGLIILWEVAPSRSPTINAVWRWALGRNGSAVHLRTFAEVGRLGREAGFAWIQSLRLRPFLWPPGPRVAVMMRKEHYDTETVHLGRGETPD